MTEFTAPDWPLEPEPVPWWHWPLYPIALALAVLDDVR